MQSITNDSFGPLVAYLVPGAVALIGLRPFFPVLDNWLASTPPDAPTIGGFLYLTVAAVAAGMITSAVRWAVVDSVHSRTGVRSPTLDFSHLSSNVAAVTLLIEIHYRHYQFFANLFVATAFTYLCYRVRTGLMSSWGGFDLAVLALEAILWAASRDTLKKYYSRSQQVLGGKR